MELAPGDKGHDHQRDGSQNHADDALFYRFLPPERQARLDQHVEGKRHKGAPDEAVDVLFPSLNYLWAYPLHLHTEPPEERRRGRAFDKTIEAKAHERNTRRPNPCPQGNDAFGDVIGQSSVYKPEPNAPPVTRQCSRFLRRSGELLAAHTCSLLQTFRCEPLALAKPR
jgi:hypothetical protein